MRCADYSTFTLRGSTISKPVLNSSNRPKGALCESTTAALALWIQRCVSHVATAANEITAKPISAEGGAMRYSDRLAHTPGRLWAITGHPDRKNIEVWC